MKDLIIILIVIGVIGSFNIVLHIIATILKFVFKDSILRIKDSFKPYEAYVNPKISTAQFINSLSHLELCDLGRIIHFMIENKKVSEDDFNKLVKKANLEIFKVNIVHLLLGDGICLFDPRDGYSLIIRSKDELREDIVIILHNYSKYSYSEIDELF